MEECPRGSRSGERVSLDAVPSSFGQMEKGQYKAAPEFWGRKGLCLRTGFALLQQPLTFRSPLCPEGPIEGEGSPDGAPGSPFLSREMALQSSLTQQWGPEPVQRLGGGEPAPGLPAWLASQPC